MTPVSQASAPYCLGVALLQYHLFFFLWVWWRRQRSAVPHLFQISVLSSSERTANSLHQSNNHSKKGQHAAQHIHFHHLLVGFLAEHLFSKRDQLMYCIHDNHSEIRFPTCSKKKKWRLLLSSYIIYTILHKLTGIIIHIRTILEGFVTLVRSMGLSYFLWFCTLPN